MRNDIKIVIIDDGVSNLFFDLNYVYENYDINQKGELLKKNREINEATHGSICAAVLEKSLPTSIKLNITCISVLDEITHKGNVQKLVKAIEWCNNNEVDLINLSLGSICLKDYWEIREITAQFVFHNKIIVAAYNNDYQYTMPASFVHIIGVSIDNKKENNLLKEFTTFEKRLDCIIKPFSWVRKRGNKRYIIKSSNSYVTPIVTGQIVKVIQGYGKEIEVNEIPKFINKDKISNKVLGFCLPDFIVDALLIELKSEIQDQYCFFNIIEKISIDEIKLSSLKQPVCVIILGRKEIEYSNLLKFILKNQPYIKGIVITGACPKELIRKLEVKYEGFFWYEEKYLFELKKISTTYNIEKNSDLQIPLIRIQYFEKENLIAFICELNKIFENEGYNTRIVCDVENSYLYGFYYVPNEFMNMAVTRFLINYFGMDLMIYVSSNKQTKQSIEFDLILNCNNYHLEASYIFKKIINSF